MLQWSIPRAHLERSRLFRDMLQKQWLKTRPRKLDLPDVDPVILRAYLHFLSEEEVPDLGSWDLIDLYVYGEQISDERLKNSVLDTILEHVETTHTAGRAEMPCPDEIEYVYENTSVGSAGRKLMVDIYHRFGEPMHLEDGYHRDFIYDLALKRLERLRDDPASIQHFVAAGFEENRRGRHIGQRETWHVSR